MKFTLIRLCDIFQTTGENSQLLLSILVKHLDHKNVAKQPSVQIHIVNIATQLARNVKLQASVAIISAITELMKHLRKCLQCSAENSSPGTSSTKWSSDYQRAIENCISELANKVLLTCSFYNLKG